MIWSQSRDIYVRNYPEFLVYEIFRNGGSLYVRENKSTGFVDVVTVARSAGSGEELVVPVGKSHTKSLTDVE
jgi:hypothetical protein